MVVIISVISFMLLSAVEVILYFSFSMNSFKCSYVGDPGNRFLIVLPSLWPLCVKFLLSLFLFWFYSRCWWFLFRFDGVGGGQYVIFFHLFIKHFL